MELILIRHADPDYRRDTITGLGQTQARALADRLKDVRLDSLYVSPLGRARDTSNYLVDALNVNAVVLDWLEEIGESWHEIEKFKKEYMEKGTSIAMGEVGLGFDPEEQMSPYYGRITSGIEDLLRSHGYFRVGSLYRVERADSEVIALVTHGGTILTLLGYLLHWAIPFIHIHTKLDAASITRLSWKPVDEGYAVPKLIGFNESCHLGEIAPGWPCDV